jgi:hypothetical protein
MKKAPKNTVNSKEAKDSKKNKEVLEVDTATATMPGATPAPPLDPPKEEEKPQDTSALMAEFKLMQSKTAEFQPEGDEGGQSEDPKTEVKEQSKETVLSVAQKAEIRLYFGFALFILTELNTFILNKLNKTVVPSDEMKLDANEINSLMPYIENEKTMMIINKLPKELLFFLQMEFMYITKFRIIAKDYPKTKPQ